MQMRRFTRLTNGFSKRFENHCHALAIYFVWYNFVKQHKSLGGISPAMAAGISDRLWSVVDIAELVELPLRSWVGAGLTSREFQTEALPGEASVDDLR